MSRPGAGGKAGHDELVEVAADWLARIEACPASERDIVGAQYASWKQQDPRHARAAARVEALLARIASLRQQTGGNVAPAGAALRAALDGNGSRPARRGAAGGDRARERRVGDEPSSSDADTATGRQRRPARAGKRLLALACAAALTAVLALALPAGPPSAWLADLRTGAGEWQSHTLADGSRLTLSSGSAADVDFADEHRTVRLLRGEVLIDVARDPRRPFLVETPQARVRALGTRFTVQREDGRTTVTMLESSVQVRATSRTPASGVAGDTAVVSAGQRIAATANGLGAVEAVDAHSIERAWRDHRLVAQGLPLPALLDQLSRHRPGWIGYDRAQLENIRVHAVLPLDDTEQALQLLANALPSLRIWQLTPYLVWVGTAAPQGASPP